MLYILTFYHIFGIFPSLTVYDVKGILMKNQARRVPGGNKKWKQNANGPERENLHIFLVF